MKRNRVIIMGAAGRDFHNFNVYFRDNEAYEVVAFTATQIPNIDERTYPAELSGELYPQGIPIYPESKLVDLIVDRQADQVIFAYSDVPHEYVMHKASMVLAAGADFRLMGGRSTMLKAEVPVISVGAVRTGCGKSQTTRRVCDILRAKGKRVVVVRHPMPYGDLVKGACQRFATYADMDRYECTIEEREEYVPHIDRGVVVYAGVDYERILRQAEKEADIVVWDGGNNDLSFYQPDLYIVVTDPHRAGHEVAYHPGETNLRLADVVVINKIDTADLANIATVRENIIRSNPCATIIEAASPIFVEDHKAISGKRVLVVEDGPTLTHGGMSYGAGIVAARRFGASEIIDPRPYAVGSIVETFAKYPQTGPLLPAMGYGRKQVAELEETINATPCDMVIVGTPIDLRRVVRIDHPAQRVRYELQEVGEPTLEDVLAPFMA
ncbi:MAG: cyclic 2,3-diphosphoglycerate synthase [Anaerolineae bacterium]|nr:cyclic 2,3-diphosphoglycerate synthase [Anaerolineae bacterium]